MKINKSDIGRWVTVKYVDVGRRDAIIVDVLDNGKLVKIFELYEEPHNVESHQIVEKRKYVNAA